MQETIQLAGYGVDTLILNVRYADTQGQPVKQELDEKLAATLDYLQSAARSAETAVARKDDAVFLTIDGLPLGLKSMNSLFVTLAKRAGIEGKKVSPHQCRRYMATTQLAASRSPLDVQRQMGHSTLGMTNRYASLSIEQLKRAHDAYSPLRAKQDANTNHGIGTGYWEEE